MRKSIVWKLFLLTTALCTLLIAGIAAGQTLFFKPFYIHQKVAGVEEALEQAAGRAQSESDGAEAAFREEQDFYRAADSWFARLDADGYLQSSDDFEITVRVDESAGGTYQAGSTLRIPLYAVAGIEELRADNPLRPDFLAETGRSIAVEGILIEGKLFPQKVARDVGSLLSEARLENTPFVLKEQEMLSRMSDAFEYRRNYPSELVKGTVTDIRIPENAAANRYENELFLRHVKDFQADLLYGDIGEQARTVTDMTLNGVDYKLFAHRVVGENGNVSYLLAMTSLQPIDEAVGVLRHYYGYVAIAAFLLVVVVSFYYARRIAKPLLRMDAAARRIASLDFEARVPVTTKDEIGSLSASLNEVASLLHAHILRLEEDIEREKRLEQTRKAFISGVSHELKTPLSVIESCLYVLKDKPESGKRDYYFAAMEDELQRMNVLVTDMLELAKYESGTYRMETSFFQIDETVERVAAKLSGDMETKHLHLRLDLFPAEVEGNPARIEQVVVNFLTNAIRYTPHGRQISVTLTEEADTVRLGIENKGAHIPEQQLEKIWDRFYRIEHSRSRDTGGTGLGLAISRQILELHDVPYSARNTADGVLFEFELNKSKT